MASTVAIGPAHRSHRRSDASCAMCDAATAPAAVVARDTRFAPLADALLPWLLTIGIAAPLALIFESAERWFALGVTAGVLAGAAFAWRLHVHDRGIAHAATKRVRSELTAEADARAEMVIRQFEWAVNDVAALREQLERSQRDQLTGAERARASDRRIQQLERQLLSDRGTTAAALAPPEAAAEPPPVELRWALRDDGPLAWLDLGADDPDALPARVRVFERDGNVIAVSDPAVHGATRDGEGRTASLVLPAPAPLAEALRANDLEAYRFEALIAHRWVAVGLVKRAGAVGHTDKRGRVWRQT